MAAAVGQGRRGGATSPVNAATGHRYRGINLFVLGMSPLAFASNNSRWCSYRQAAARGWQVRKGEKATPVYFYKPIEIEDKTTDGGRKRGASRSCARSRSFTPPRSMESQRLPLPSRQRLWPSGSRTSRSSFRQAASLSGSAGTGRFTTQLSISCSTLGQAFHSPELRAATLFHELSHATGHVSRLDRDLSGGFGSMSYAKEELRAELASCAIGFHDRITLRRSQPCKLYSIVDRLMLTSP